MLSVENLTKTFGPVVAVDDVSCDISDKEIVALAGGNGSGKTTLLKIIAGALAPDKGRVKWDGGILEPANPYKTRMRGIEMVFQDCALCPESSVLENLFLGREITSRGGFLAIREMKDRARKMIERYDLPIPDLDIKAQELSGGQQKSVAIGRALLSNPRLLILDEPTAALGVKEQETVLRIIRELRSKGAGIIFCTHSPDEILSVAERILVLNRGKLAHDRKAADLSRAQLQSLMSA